ncbi:uncharacterized protein LOC144906184 [Branchiostoma floridae x Branchiostoma belcheri]
MANTTASAVVMTTTLASPDSATSQGLLGGQAIAAIACASFIFVLLILAGIIAVVRAVRKNKNTVQPEHGDTNILIGQEDAPADPVSNSNDENHGNGDATGP